MPQDRPWRGEFVPLLDRIAAGPAIDRLLADEFSAGDADAFLHYNKEAPSRAFALRVEGDSMEPDFRSGDVVVVDPDQRVTDGLACVCYEIDGQRRGRLKCIRPSGLARARLPSPGGRKGKDLVLESLNPAHPPERFKADQVDAFKVIAHLPLIRKESAP